MYYVILCDDFSSYHHIFPLMNKTKESVFDVFKFYIALSERQTGRKLIKFTLDRGSEFLNELMGGLLRELGIILHLTAAHTPDQNGVSERGNRTIVTKAGSMMLDAGTPLRFWYEACKTAVFLTNRTVRSSPGENQTPYEMWFGRKASVEHLKTWGCLSYIHIRKEARESKFDQVATEGVLVGFEDDNFNFHVYDMKTIKLIITHNARFNKSVFPFINQSTPPTEDNTPTMIGQAPPQFFDDNSDTDSDGEMIPPKSQPNPEKAVVAPPDTIVCPNGQANASQILLTPTPISRSSKRPVGKIPNYGGMNAEHSDYDLTVQHGQTVIKMSALAAQFDCLLERLNTSAVNLTSPKSFKKATRGAEGEKWL